MIKEKKKPSEAALQIAALCWCDDETSMIEMDIRLAEAFARRYDKLRKENHELREEIESLQPYEQFKKDNDDET